MHDQPGLVEEADLGHEMLRKTDVPVWVSGKCPLLMWHIPESRNATGLLLRGSESGAAPFQTFTQGAHVLRLQPDAFCFWSVAMYCGTAPFPGGIRQAESCIALVLFQLISKAKHGSVGWLWLFNSMLSVRGWPFLSI